MWFAIIATILVAILSYKIYFRPSKAFFKKYGIREIDYSPALSKLDLVRGRKVIYDGDDFVYQQLGHEKLGGMTEIGRPMVLVKDLDLIKKIMIKDFDHFADRRNLFSGNDRWVRRMLFFMEGEEWKGVRSAISPTFTTGKIRRMMDYFNSIGLEWVQDLQEKGRREGEVIVNVGKSVKSFTIDVIASAAFGLNAGTIKNPDSKFAEYAAKLLNVSKIRGIYFALNFFLPNVFGFLKIDIFDRKATSFFTGMLDQGLKSRLNGEVKKNDFLQLLAETKKGELKAEGDDELSEFEKDAAIITSQVRKQWLTDEVLSAQCMSFFFAGYQPTTGFIAFLIYVLAAYPDVQVKVREEVDRIAKEDATFDYDDLGQLVYLDMVLSEVNRKFPSQGRLERLCVKDYKDPDSGLCIPKGTNVIIPVKSLHHDKNYFHNVDDFYPENFTPERKAERNPYAFMPFGIGPRNCVGMRFALIEAKTAVAHLVHNFEIQPTNRTPLPVRAVSIGFQEVAPDMEVKMIPLR